MGCQVLKELIKRYGYSLVLFIIASILIFHKTLLCDAHSSGIRLFYWTTLFSCFLWAIICVLPAVRNRIQFNTLVLLSIISILGLPTLLGTFCKAARFSDNARHDKVSACFDRGDVWDSAADKCIKK